ncbi:kelch repeat and BTB domain-containing protein 3 isoform X2 [Thalassophryne amazonica]|uniref:kelch repeat and BTB domain-containing protein 3 isoform X2 n=1 Tax=Thalassophryne amazonica TaxID=390379 RepID=UPI0014711E43|nr:kelch repeat and BTB domain-containing protein 3 isoform X2 [Thalassophryne amazonica]
MDVELSSPLNNAQSHRDSTPSSCKPSSVPQCNVAAERSTVLRVSESHGMELLCVLRSFRKQGILFDFMINVQDHSFPCHRCVLAACSDFFRAMFEVDMRERDDGSVTLGNQSPVAVDFFLDFAYSGEAVITASNVDMLFQLSSYLQDYGSTYLLQNANEFVAQNFYSLSLTKEFLSMQVKVLETCLRTDAINVPSEEAVVMALLRWIHHDLPRRQKLLPGLLSLTRLHHVPAAALTTLWDSDPLLCQDESCLTLLSKVQSKQSKYSGLFTDARPSTTHSYIFIYKTERVHHTFCYSLETEQWKELGLEHSGPTLTVPDPPGCCFTSFAEKIFVTGGCRGNCSRTIRLHVGVEFHDATNEVWCFCPVTRDVTSVKAMLKPRTMHAAVTCLGQVYAIGGCTRGFKEGASSLLEVECYNPLSQSWSFVSQLPTAIFYPEATVCGSIIYMLGSEVEMSDHFNPSLDCFLRYDAQLDQWCRLTLGLGQVFHATLVKSVSVSSMLYFCDLSTYKVYSVCPETCTMEEEGSLEYAGFNAGAVAVKDRIYILGGDYSPDEISDEVQVFYTGRSQWELVASMPRALTEFHCQLISFSSYRDPWAERT